MIPKCRKCNTPQPAAAPAWADPRAVMSGSAYRVTVFVNEGPLNSDLPILPADPKRIAVGFCCGSSGSAYVATTPDPLLTGWAVTGAGGASIIWFTLFEHGPMVNVEWLAYCPVGDRIAIHEVYRLF